MSLPFWLQDGESDFDQTRWVPLETISALLELSPRATTIDPDDYMYVANFNRRGLPRLHVYRHYDTGRSLSLDDDLHAWSYRPGAPGAVDGYVLLTSLADAIDELGSGLAQPRSTGRRSASAHDATAETPATVSTDGQAPSLLASGCEPPNPPT